MIQEFDTRLEKIKVELAEQGFNSELYYKNKVVLNLGEKLSDTGV